MDSMVTQTIQTEISKSEILMTLKELIEAQTIKEGTLGLQETSYISVWGQEELEVIKGKIFEVLSQI